MKVKILLIMFGLSIGVLLAEIGLRFANYSYPVFHLYDEHIGPVPRPNAKGWYRKEGKAYIQINSDGLRDREHTIAKPTNTLRIAVLGDSYAEALQVPMEKTFWSVMEHELSNCQSPDGRKVEVINFGVNNYGTASELLMLRYRVWKYNPDIVILAVTTGNDIRNNLRTLEKTDYIPYFYYYNGELVLDKSFCKSKAYRERVGWKENIRKISNYSRVLQLLRNVSHKYSEGAQPIQQQNQNEIGLDDNIYIDPPPDSEWELAWQITEGLITLMYREVLEKGAKFLVVTLSNSIQVNPDPSARKIFMKRLNLTDLFYPDLRINALAERVGFDVLILAPKLQLYAEENHVCVHGFENAVPCGGHWNINGHNIAGKLMAQKLCEIIDRDNQKKNK